METDRITFLQATQRDTDSLRSLAYESEAYWGYDSTFMKKFDQDFNITDCFIQENPVYMAVIDKKIIAFWGLRQNADDWELEYFYIAVGHMRKGYGRHMWSHLITWCRGHDITTLRFVTSPQAAEFYEKMGAVQDKKVPSVIDGRLIPHFVYAINGD